MSAKRMKKQRHGLHTGTFQHNINKWTLSEIKHLLGIRKKNDAALMVEAFRRKHFIRPGAIGDRSNTLGLGLPSTYKSIYFTVADGREVKRVDNWYKLTPAGEKMMELIELKFEVPYSLDACQIINEYLFSIR